MSTTNPLVRVIINFQSAIIKMQFCLKAGNGLTAMIGHGEMNRYILLALTDTRFRAVDPAYGKSINLNFVTGFRDRRCKLVKHSYGSRSR